MRIRPTHLIALAGLALAAGTAQAQDRRPLTALDLYHLKQAGGVALSPDGQRAVFVVTEVDSAENRYRRDLWIANTDGSGMRRLTWTNARGIGGAAFSPDGRMLAFTQSRQGRAAGRARRCGSFPLAEGGEAWPLTEHGDGRVRPGLVAGLAAHRLHVGPHAPADLRARTPRGPASTRPPSRISTTTARPPWPPSAPSWPPTPARRTRASSPA